MKPWEHVTVKLSPLAMALFGFTVPPVMVGTEHFDVSTASEKNQFAVAAN